MSHRSWRDKILGHLRFARMWLERAEADFSQDDTLQGELNLALVEAEVRHAWEVSAGKLCQEEHVSKRPRTIARAVGLVAGVFLVLAGLWHWGWQRPEGIKKAQTGEAVQLQEPETSTQALPQITGEPTSSPTVKRAKKELAQEDVVAVPTAGVPEKPTSIKVKSPQEPKGEVAQVKTQDPPPEPLPVDNKEKEELKVEHNLSELTQLAREVLYANSDS